MDDQQQQDNISYTYFFKDIRIEIWVNTRGEYHRKPLKDEDISSLPAVIYYNNITNEILHKEYWYHGKKYELKEPEPTTTNEYYLSGNIKYKKSVYDKFYYHNSKGPALTIYFDNKEHKKESEHYYILDHLHRDNDKPAVIIYNKNGEVICKKWYINNQLSREIGPALIMYDELNGGMLAEYWKNGELLKKISYQN